LDLKRIASWLLDPPAVSLPPELALSGANGVDEFSRVAGGEGPASTLVVAGALVSGGPVESVAREQVQFTQTIIDEDQGWRSLISGGMRELTWAQIIERLNNVTDYYRTNPLAFRLIQLQVDHVLGDGLVLKSSDERVQAELDLWWDHPLNNLSVRQFEMLTGLAMDGEIFVTIHENPYDLSSYVRMVPAALVDRIETNPEDLQDELRFHQTAQPVTPETLMSLPSVVQAEGRWWDRAEMKHFAVNRPVGVVRGQSDLAPLLPWLRRYRDWLTDRVRLNKFRTAYLWHVQLKGADRRAILQRQAELAVPPSPGSIIVSNENETWAAVAPDIKASDVAPDGLAIRLMIAAGAGVPLYWLAEAEHTARGTAAEMSEPSYRHYRQRQLYFGWLMRTLAVDALRRRGLADVTVADVEAEFPEMDPTTAFTVAAAMAQVTDSLVLAKGQGWLTDDDAARVYQHFLGQAVNLPGTGGDPSQGSEPALRGEKGQGPTPGARSGKKRGVAGRRGQRGGGGTEPPDAGAQLPPSGAGGGSATEPIVHV
jgi:hypothetical protein